MSGRLSTLAVIEGSGISGPIKPLLNFQSFARTPAGRAAGLIVESCIVTTARGAPKAFGSNRFVQAASALQLRIEVLHERHAFDWRVLRQLVDLIERFQPDIVESHSYKPHLLVRLARARSRHRFRWVAFHHGYTAESLRVLIYNQIDRWTLPRAERVITFCRPFAEQLATRGVRRESIDIIKNAATSAERSAQQSRRCMRSSFAVSAEDFVILCVGRLSREKGHAVLIRAAQILVSECPEARFKIIVVGAGPDRGRLEAMAGPLGNRVLFAGYREDVEAFYLIADVFVLPSYSEGSPLALLEAMQAGLPIVATAVGGVPEMVAHDESALLIRPGSARDMAEAVGRLIQDDALRIRLGNAARRAVEQYSVPRYFDRLSAIFAALVGTTPRVRRIESEEPCG